MVDKINVNELHVAVTLEFRRWQNSKKVLQRNAFKMFLVIWKQ